MKLDLVAKIKKDLRRVADQDRAKVLARFFKTGKGEYGEGDKFLGVTMPAQRAIAKNFFNLSLSQISLLLKSVYHEERNIALIILVNKYKPADKKFKKQVFNFYLKNISRINNWDLVDLSAPNIVGDYIFNFYNKKEVASFLLKLAKAKNLWSRRIAVLATFAFVKNNQLAEILELAEFLLIKPLDSAQGKQRESHDLIHKALGWMLRETGKRNKKILINFLNKFGSLLPRTTLRYALEKFSLTERQKYLSLK